MSGVYLDYNGSAPLDPRVLEAMMPILAEGVGNASSVHRFGRLQAATVDEAREQVAALVGGRPGHIVFTAGATEANNLALRGLVEGGDGGRSRVLVSAVEHASVRQTAEWLDDQGLAKIDVVPVTGGGFVDPDVVETMMGPDVLLVSVMAANSETGVLNPVADIARRVHAGGALFHCDATQMAGRLAFDLDRMGADLVSLSGHKICGPGGVGALVGTRRSLRRLRPIIHGGGHERGLRSGSVNVPGVVGFGTAARIASEERDDESRRVGKLRDRLVAEPKDSPWYDGRYNAATPSGVPQRSSRTCSEPASPSYAAPTTSPKPTKHTSTASSTPIHVSTPPGTRSKSSTNSTKPTTRIKLTRRSDGSLISTPPARSPNTAKSWTRSSPGENRSWPTTPPGGYPTDPSQGSTTSTRVLRRVAHGFTNPDNYAARGILVT